MGPLDKRTYSRIIWFALALVVLLHVCLPLANGKLNSGHDTLRYLPRLVEFHENIRQGNWIPRWAPDLTLGQGQPLFFFSPGVPYYVAELWHLTGFDYAGALNGGALTMVLLSAFSMFLLCSLYFGEKGGLLGAMAYIYSPYFDVDLYVRGAYSEFSAMAFYPLALYGFARYGVEKNPKALVLGAVSLAAVELSHNPTALLFAPVLLGFAIFQAIDQKSWRMLWWQVGALALGIALAAFFWVPALLDIGNVHSERLTGGYFDYRLHFVELPQLVSTFWGYGGSVPGGADQMSLSLGWSHVLLGLIALTASIWLRTAVRRVQWFFAGTLAALCVLMLPVSGGLWHFAPLLQYTQFPWRLLAPAGVCLGVVVASLAAIGYGENFRIHTTLLIAVLLLAVPNWSHSAPQSYVAINPESWTADAIARRGVETTAMREFETKWMRRVLPYDAERFLTISGDATVKMNHQARPTAWSATASANTPSLIEARLLYYPGWSVFIDGTEAPVIIAPESGRVRFDLPPGQHSVFLSLSRTSPVLIGESISVASVLFLFAFWLFRRRAM